jgi:hypothetical protein
MKNASEISEGIKKTDSLCRTPQQKHALAQFHIIAEGLAELEKAIAVLQQESLAKTTLL